MKKLAETIAKNREDKAKIRAKNILKAKITLGVIAFIVVTGLLVKAIDIGVMFFRENTIVKYQVVKVQLHSPIEIVSLNELRQRETMEKIAEEISVKAVESYLNPPKTPQCTKDEITQVNPKEFFEVIWKHESGKGTNTDPTALHIYCRNKGKWNEIGYNPQDKFCFGSKTEAEYYVAYYLEKNCKGMTMSQALCRWNTGTASDTCAYSEGNLSMVN